MADNGTPDLLQQAVAAAEKPTERRSSAGVVIASTGRQMLIEFPADLTDGELAEFMGWCGSQLLNGLRQQRLKTGRLVLP